MRYRISSLLLIVLLIAGVLALATRIVAQPSWLVSMRGKSESELVAMNDGRWHSTEFKPTESMMAGPRKRIKSTIPPDCNIVRERRFHDTTYVYYAWLEFRDGDWFVFDTTYHHEDSQWPPSQ